MLTYTPERLPGGIYAQIPTFFKPRNADSDSQLIDHDILATIAKVVAHGGARGIVVLGNLDDALQVNSTQRKALISGLRKALDAAMLQKVVLVAATTSSDSHEAAMELKLAQEAGATYGLVPVPMLAGTDTVATSQEGIVSWYDAVAANAEMPFLVHHNPGLSSTAYLTPETIVALSKINEIVGCSLSYSDISKLKQIASHPDLVFDIFTCLGEQLAVVRGAGAIDAVACIFPKSLAYHVNLMKYEEKDLNEDRLEARKTLEIWLKSMRELVVLYGELGIKAAITNHILDDVAGSTNNPFVDNLPGGKAGWKKWDDTFMKLFGVEMVAPNPNPYN